MVDNFKEWQAQQIYYKAMLRAKMHVMIKIVLLIFVLLSSTVFAQQKKSAMTIEQILALPEKEIDIGLADLILAKEFYPDLKVELYLFTFDYMASRYRHFFGHITDPDERIRALNTYLYKRGSWNDSISFCYDDDDLNVAKLSNKFINGYISTKKGSCITLPMMYLILAERLGFPIYPSRLPYHFFVRYIPEDAISNFEENIEATNGGSYVSDTEYAQNFLLPERSIINGVYLRTLTKKQYIASLLLINANEWLKNKNVDKAKYYLQLSIKYDSIFSSAYMNYAMIHLYDAMYFEDKMIAEIESEKAYYDILAKNKSTSQSLPHQPMANNNQPSVLTPQPDYSTFQIQVKDNLTPAVKPRQAISASQPTQTKQALPNVELQNRIAEIEQQYVPRIQADTAIYHQYKRKAEDLGIVRGYPLLFFQNQSTELKHFQEKGAK
jgi:regulator of sirC expression with transglutaminase-like and TPR domain